MTLDNMTGITKGSYTGSDLFCKSQLITCNRVKECNGVCPFEDALKHADKEMEEQTVIDHDRDWIIGCIKHDGFIKTDRFDKANQIILEALQADAVHGEWIPCSERLPSKDGCYLVSTTGTNNDIIDIAYYTEGMIWRKASRIKAWQPLPKPYREDGEDNEED